MFQNFGFLEKEQTLWFPAYKGTWGEPEYCPDGEFATNYRIKIEAPNYDNSALNGVELSCQNGKEISSDIGIWGDWKVGSNMGKICHGGFTEAKITIQDEMVNIRLL